MLNEVKNARFKKAVQTITYMPHFISLVIICALVMDFCSTRGLINTLILKLGGTPINFMNDPDWFYPIYTISGIWQHMGWDSIIYLAALSSIDPALYEAATVDGAGRFRRMWHITLPGIASTISILLILRIGSIMSVGYEKIILLYSPATYETADTISTYVYRRGLHLVVSDLPDVPDPRGLHQSGAGGLHLSGFCQRGGGRAELVSLVYVRQKKVNDT